MGDRANIIFLNQADQTAVGFYSHWSGSRLREVATGIVNNSNFRGRLGDTSYATRIGLSECFESLQCSSKEETGSGVFVVDCAVRVRQSLPDNEHQVIVISVCGAQAGKMALIDEDRALNSLSANDFAVE